MQIRLASIRVVSAKEAVETVVSHNHRGMFRDRGECPACDQFHELYGSMEQAA